MFESFKEHLENKISEESNLRQKIEKKAFTVKFKIKTKMSENFNAKISTIRNGFDDILKVMTEEVETLKIKLKDDIEVNNERIEENIKGYFKKMDGIDFSNKEMRADLENLKL